VTGADGRNKALCLKENQQEPSVCQRLDYSKFLENCSLSAVPPGAGGGRDEAQLDLQLVLHLEVLRLRLLVQLHRGCERGCGAGMGAVPFCGCVVGVGNG